MYLFNIFILVRVMMYLDPVSENYPELDADPSQFLMCKKKSTYLLIARGSYYNKLTVMFFLFWFACWGLWTQKNLGQGITVYC